MECNICCDKYNKTSRKLIRCDYDKCGYEACFSCVKRYFLDTTEKPHCMNCKKEWTREILVDKLPSTFINKDLKQHRENLLYEIEKGLLPATQPSAEKEKKIREYQEIKKSFREKLTKVNKIYYSYGNDIFDIEEQRKLKDMRIEINTYKEEIKFYDNCIRAIQLNKEKKEKIAFIKPCPQVNCRGFLSSGWKCGLCSVKVCSQCHEIKENEEHECKPDVLETVKMLKKDSKPCPKCGSLIQKIEGCSQMFHTPLSGGCGAIFDWNTLKLHTGGAIHNPHYFEYLRHQNGGNIPRQRGDELCGGLPTYVHFVRHLGIKERENKISRLQSIEFSKLYEAYVHNDDVELRKYFVDVLNDNENLRIQYLLNDINEEQFKKKLQQKEKANDKKRNLYLILHMYQTTILDILQRILNTSDKEKFSEFHCEVKNLLTYTNENLEKVCSLYKCKLVKVNIEDYVIE